MEHKEQVAKEKSPAELYYEELTKLMKGDARTRKQLADQNAMKEVHYRRKNEDIY